MSGAPPDVVVTPAPLGTTIHTLPSSNAAGTTDIVALPVQGVVGGVPISIAQPSTVGDTYVSGGATVVALAAAGGAASHIYVPGQTITLNDGAATTHGVLTVASTQVVSATVAAGGTGGTTGTQTVTGTTGTGTPFQASVTVSGGAITAVLSITVAGAYTLNPTVTTAEPVTGASLSGAQLNVIPGVLTATITTPGVVTAVPSNPVAQLSSSGAGTGATFTMTYAPIAQSLFGGTAPVTGWKVNNPNATGDFWVSDSGVTPTANGASSFRVFANGGQFSTESGEKATGFALQLLGATIGAPIIARRY